MNEENKNRTTSLNVMQTKGFDYNVYKFPSTIQEAISHKVVLKESC